MSRLETRSIVQDIMRDFAARTGLTSARPPQRYLWTDAFAVCNYLGLYTSTGDAGYRDLALQLVDQVHHVLGRHRADDARQGWISGLEGEAAEQHPTAGGLRIGKELPERPPGERLDQRLEWDRDGQYFHYLTRWMHALNRTSSVTRDPDYNRWAMEMARRVYAAFTYRPAAGGPPRMYWKMSIDLSRPLVPTMGHHDPLDAYITYLELQAAAPRRAGWPDLANEVSDAGQMVSGRDWTTTDPLGTGGLLADAYRVAQLVVTGHFPQAEMVLVLLESALLGLMGYIRQGPLRQAAAYRLAFRELGLATGLLAGQRLQALVAGNPGRSAPAERVQEPLQALSQYAALAEEIESFWLDPRNQAASTWTDHLNINAVMLATSLAPDGYLSL